ncbi:hypothetical protein BJX65DRAFT_303407 [Aspergillus insuetus]
MTAILTTSVPWHDGEDKMHQLLRVPYQDNPTVPFLTRPAALLMKQSPLLAIGALDQGGRPWASVWGGEVGFATATSHSSFNIRTPVGRTYDPVVESLLLNSTGNSGKAMAFLAVDLETRRRVKLFGKLDTGSLDISDEDERISAGIANLSVHVDGSLGNCPKYLNAKRIVPAPPEPKLISETPQLHPSAIDLLNRADTLFISSSHGGEDMDTNIRGGPSGFARVISNQPSGAVFVYPEYSGNRLYQTLGNLQTTPSAGFVFPDFDTGNALFATGTTEIIVGRDASDVLPRSNIVVRVTVTAARFVEKALSFRGIPGKPSPYNPSVRYLTSERVSAAVLGNRESKVTATLIGKELITSSIGRFRFRISDPKEARLWIPGQYATFSFYEELDMGYSHMRDDDPSSINDDYVRTFTISSSPGHLLPDGDFEITARKQGNVTSSLFRTSERAGLEVPLKGFGGDFQLNQRTSDILPFIAGGIGITPVLAHLPVIDISRLRLIWSISLKDIGLVLDTFKRFPKLPGSTTVFVTGVDDRSQQSNAELEHVASSGAQLQRRRMEAQDIDISLSEVWYFCGSPALKVPVFNWLAIEHNTADPSNPTQPSRSRRPDLSTFFATLSEVSSDENRSRQGAVPPPGDISALYYSLAEGLTAMRLNGGGSYYSLDINQIREQLANQADNPILPEADNTSAEHGDDLLQEMIQILLQRVDRPPKEVEGVSEEFCDGLDRVPRSSLKPSQSCPICSNPFLDDKYPLVVRLPCHPTHLFDLECVRPWLRLRGTCPLDRTDFAQQLREKAEARKKAVEEDDEEEWDGMYG